jgi:ketosteroid isomerase-like protein
VGFYTDDAILFPPKGEPIRGREAIRAYWTRTPDSRILEHSIQTELAAISGDLLTEHGRLSLTSQAGEKLSERGSANFISVWRRSADGLWRKHLDSWW